MANFKETLGINEITQKKHGIWKALLAEFLGNLLLNFFGCASVACLKEGENSFVLIALAFGLTIFIVVQVKGNLMILFFRMSLYVSSCANSITLLQIHERVIYNMLKGFTFFFFFKDIRSRKRSPRQSSRDSWNDGHW